MSLAPWLCGRDRAYPHASVYVVGHWFGCRGYDPGLHAKSPWRAVRTATHMAAFPKTGAARG